MPKAVRFFCKFLSIVIALGLLLCALVFGGLAYFNAPPEGGIELVQPHNEDVFVWGNSGMRLEEDGALIFEVRNGESAQSVGSRLQNAGIIRNRYFWNLLFRLDGEFLKTGTYRIELPASQMQIRSILTTGDQLLIRVTIPEGFTLGRTARLLEEAGICKADDFLTAASSRVILDAYNIPGASMEGYLYPDTYLFPLAYPAQRVVATMADNFFLRLQEIDTELSVSLAAMSAEELNRRIILASIVEREYRVPDEAPVMAGVFNNRLRIGMALQSCATVEYVITEILGLPHPAVLLYRDLEIRSPFNTYLNRGLPPGPISAPGKIALKAAFEPATTSYLYFRLIDVSTGRHYFSRTLDEHIRAAALIVKGR
jgi:UPF0755 protein